MWPIVTDQVAWSVGLSVGLCVGLSLTVVIPAKTAESIEMQQGSGLALLKEPGIRWGPDPPMGKGQF